MQNYFENLEGLSMQKLGVKKRPFKKPGGVPSFRYSPHPAKGGAPGCRCNTAR